MARRDWKTIPYVVSVIRNFRDHNKEIGGRWDRSGYIGIKCLFSGRDKCEVGVRNPVKEVNRSAMRFNGTTTCTILLQIYRSGMIRQ